MRQVIQLDLLLQQFHPIYRGNSVVASTTATCTVWPEGKLQPSSSNIWLLRHGEFPNHASRHSCLHVGGSTPEPCLSDALFACG